MTRSFEGRTVGLVVLAVLSLMLTLLAAPSAAEEAGDADVAASVERYEHARARAASGTQATPSGGAWSSHGGPHSGNCYVDFRGDTVNESSGQFQAFPRADIVQFCESVNASGLTLSMRVDEPTNPRTDPNWNFGTYAAWFIDINGDGEGDFFVDYALNVSGALTSRVLDLRGGEQVEPVGRCDGVPRFSGGSFIVGGIPLSCIAEATSVRSSPATSYDVDGGDNPARFTDFAPFQQAPVVSGSPRAIGRLAGPGRIETAIEISGMQFPDSPNRTRAAELLFLARADLFADAVVGGVLTGGPILLLPSTGTLPANVRAEIDRVNPVSVIALGGTVAISQSMLDQASAGRQQGRLGGATRIETAGAISQFQFPQGPVDDVYIARQDVFADAVAGGSLTRGPILLVPTCGSAPAIVNTEIGRLNPARVAALGGTAAICDPLLMGLAAGRTRARIAGPGRIETAVAISRDEFPDPPPPAEDQPAPSPGARDVYLARADLFADAVVGGVLTDGPILLVPTCGALPARVREEIVRINPARVIALGGTAAICQPLLVEAGNAVG